MNDRLWVLVRSIRTRQALRTYLFLLTRCDEHGLVKISRSDIYAEVADSVSNYNAHVRRWLDELIGAGLLAIHASQPGATNTYKITRPTIEEVQRWLERTTNGPKR